jgi:hypothetical protein
MEIIPMTDNTKQKRSPDRRQLRQLRKFLEVVVLVLSPSAGPEDKEQAIRSLDDTTAQGPDHGR